MSLKGRAVRVIIVPTDDKPQLAEVEDNLLAYQRIVGGYIERAAVCPDGTEVYCNEDGIMQGLEPNQTAYVMTRGKLRVMGPIFVVRANSAGEFTSVTDEDCKRFGIKVERKTVDN